VIKILTNMLKQTAVYWESTGFDDYGQPTFASPVEVAVRWEDVAEEFIDASGTRQVSKSKVFVGVDLEAGGLLRLGDLDAVEASSFPADPRDDDGVDAIRSFTKTPDFKGKQYLRVAML
jgi:hypothetical protein